MRIFGWILLITGLVFGLVLVLAAIGGAGWSTLRGVVYCVVFASLGWRLTKYGKGLGGPPAVSVQTGADGGAAAAAAVGAAFATQEIPLTPQAQAQLLQYRSQQRRQYAILISIIAGVLMVLYAAIGWSDLQKGDWSIFLLLGPTSAVAVALLVGGIYFFTRELPLRKDLRDWAFLQTTGPIETVRMSNSYMLRLEDRAFFIYQKHVAKTLEGVGWATVMYSRHAHFIFEVRDRDGRIVFQTS